MASSGRRCPICGKPVAPRDRNKGFPFCSPRCQLIDLGHWLEGDYKIDEPDGNDDGWPPPPLRGGEHGD